MNEAQGKRKALDLRAVALVPNYYFCKNWRR